MKLHLDKTAASGTKEIRGTKSDLHRTPIPIPIRAQGREDKTHERGSAQRARARKKTSSGYDGILKQH